MEFKDSDDREMFERIIAGIKAPFRFVRESLRGPIGHPGLTGMTGMKGDKGEPGRSGSDICCPHCGSWVSELPTSQRPIFTFPAKDPAYNNDMNFCTMFCLHCENESHWFTDAPMLIPAGDVIINRQIRGNQKRKHRNRK